MTKEELEKEAEEYQIRKHHQRLYGHKPVVMKELNTTYIASAELREKRIADLEKENALVKSLLYCTERTCDNCGFVNCENFQRQRKSEPCSLYIPYQVRIKNLVHESDVLRESYNNSEMNLASVSEQLAKAKNLIEELASSLSVVGECDEEECELINKAQKFINKPIF